MMDLDTYPTTDVLGEDLYRSLTKGQLAALVVDLHYAALGEDSDDQTVRAEIATRLDVLAAAGIVPRKLPARFPRAADDLTED